MNPTPDSSPETTPEQQDNTANRGGKIVTFYSYKGGVGRSMALANIAVILAKDHGQDVVVVDWDLEAPGLHRFFGLDNQMIDRGVIDYLYHYQELLFDSKLEITKESLSIEPLLIQVRPQPQSNDQTLKGKGEDLRYESGGRIRILPAGNLTDHKAYAQRVTSFDWNDFYKSWNGGQCIEHIRNQLKDLSTVALIDSRTGVTDISGICTMQLPDVVVLTFAFNEQNIDGIERVAIGLTGEDPVFDQTERRPGLLLLPSRRDISERVELDYWEKFADAKLGGFVSENPVAQKFGSTLDYLVESAIPYIPFYSYGEKIAVESDLGREIVRPLRQLSQALLSDETQEQKYRPSAAIPTPLSQDVTSIGVSPSGRTRVSRRALILLLSIAGLVAVIVTLLVGASALGLWPFSGDVSVTVSSIRFSDDPPRLFLEGTIGNPSQGDHYWIVVPNDNKRFWTRERIIIGPSETWSERVILDSEFCSADVVTVIILESESQSVLAGLTQIPSDANVLSIFPVSPKEVCAPQPASPK